MTLGKNNLLEWLIVCKNYEFNLLHHIGVVAKRCHATAETAMAHEGDDDTPSGRTVPLRAQHAEG